MSVTLVLTDDQALDIVAQISDKLRSNRTLTIATNPPPATPPGTGQTFANGRRIPLGLHPVDILILAKSPGVIIAPGMIAQETKLTMPDVHARIQYLKNKSVLDNESGQWVRTGTIVG